LTPNEHFICPSTFNRNRSAVAGHPACFLFEFASYGGLKILETADIPAWSRKAGDKTAADWVRNLGENDRDRVGQPLQLSKRSQTRDHDQIRR